MFPRTSRMKSFISISPVCILAYCLHSCEIIRSASTTTVMTGTHLTIGSIDPDLVPGNVRIYSMRFCPFSHRAHLVLLAKNISFDPVFINLKAKPEWYTNKVPSGKVPALIVDKQNVYESLIIADFLDEKYPQRPLHSKDPLQKAKDRILIESFGKVISPFYKVMVGANASEEQFEEVLKELTAFDKELTTRGAQFFGGDKPGMVDYMIWPWFERLQMFKVLYGDKFVLSKDRLPSLTNWVENMKADEAVKKYYVSPEKHAEFMKTHQAGSPDYDILNH